MTAGVMDLNLLQAADGTAEYIREKIDRCQKATAVVICSFVIFPKLREIRSELVCLQENIGELEINNDEDRAWTREKAQFFMGIAKKIETTEAKYKGLVQTVWPIFNFINRANLVLLDQAYCLAEDAAESLALIASKEFMESLEGDLRKIHDSAQG